ncbi:MAG: phenylacetate--CoA ligase [Candidatus Rokubacteria bacterium RIFCSPLOWO2_02_FULL_71_18]|nr:MAG: phenylacetate--CoA ligase [Candidatus Rokubacteria bacterium RIFCSPLOWO2_02_FULL_71_18]
MDLTVWPPRYDPAYRPAAGAEHWLPEVECADPRDRDALILAKLRRQVAWAWERSPFYRRTWEAAGVSPATLRSLDDLPRFPVVQKSELRAAQEAHPPFGDYLCVEPGQIARIHGTSGTTGRPTVFGVGRDDWARVGEAHARILWGAGLRPDDRILICSFFSLYLGSWGALAGGERLGATMFPFGAGVPGQTLMAVQWALELRPTAFYGTPSYALHFAETARREGIDPKRLGFRTLVFSGEPGAGIPATKRQIEETFSGACLDMGSMAEMTPWMTNGECRRRTGMHLWQDLVYTQVCDPETWAPVPPGAEGTPVYTHLERTSQPMIRLVSGDRARWTDAPCPCGRTYPRLPDGLYGRIDDMLVVRGENVYPSAIEDVLRAVEGFGGEFRVIVSRREAMDELLVRAEYAGSHASPEAQARLRAAMAERLRARLGVRPLVELVPEGTLERSEFKARRVIDDRDLYRKRVGEATA